MLNDELLWTLRGQIQRTAPPTLCLAFSFGVIIEDHLELHFILNSKTEPYFTHTQYQITEFYSCSTSTPSLFLH